VEVALHQLRDPDASAEVHQSSLESLARLAWSDDEASCFWRCGPAAYSASERGAGGAAWSPPLHQSTPCSPPRMPTTHPKKVREAVASGGGVRGIVDALAAHCGDDAIVCNACLALMALVRGESEVCQSNQVRRAAG
jgi:hypothetical protein